MKKEKKISVRLFLNKKIKPLYDKDTPCYPIYIQLNYDRKNVKFRPDFEVIFMSYTLDYIDNVNDVNVGEYDEVSYVSEEMFQKANTLIKEKHNPEGIHEDGVLIFSHIETIVLNFSDLIKAIYTIVDRELELKIFNLKGFGKRLKMYLSNPYILLDIELCKVLNAEAKGKLTLQEKRVFKLSRTALDKFIFLKRKLIISRKFHQKIFKTANALFWLGYFADVTANDELYKWSLNFDSMKNEYLQFFKRPSKNVDEYFQENMKDFDFFKTPRTPEILEIFHKFIHGK